MRAHNMVETLDDAWFAEVEFQDEMFDGWRVWPHSFVANALAGEGGEETEEAFPIEIALLHLRMHVAQGKVSNIAKKLDGGGTNRKNVSSDKCAEELADVFIYMVLLAQLLGYDSKAFSQIVADKIKKNYERMEER